MDALWLELASGRRVVLKDVARPPTRPGQKGSERGPRANAAMTVLALDMSEKPPLAPVAGAASVDAFASTHRRNDDKTIDRPATAGVMGEGVRRARVVI